MAVRSTTDCETLPRRSMLLIGADDGGEGEAGNGNVNAHSFRGEVDLVQVLGEIAADVGKQGAAGDLALALGLAHGVVQARRAEVVVEAALDGVAQARACRQKGSLRSAGGASGVGALDLDGRVDGGDAVGGPGDWRFHGGDRAALSGAAGERQRGRQRVLRLAGLGRPLGEGRGRAQVASRQDCG